MIHLAQFQPEIPQNTGTLLRTSACLGVTLDIIDPCGFGLSDSRLKRAGMDYVDLAHYNRHLSWDHFQDTCQAEKRRIVYLTPHAKTSYLDFKFQENDTLLLGRESNGIPSEISQTIEHQITIPMTDGTRSMNVAIAGALVLGEALRQIMGQITKKGVEK